MKKYDSYKDSGIEWIGVFPNHWKRIKFKLVTNLITCGHAATPSYVENGGKPFLSAQNIKNEKIDLIILKFITKELHEQLIKNHKVEKGDLLQVRVGGADTIGQTAIYDLDFDVSIYVSLAHIKLNKHAFNGFIKHLCNSSDFKTYCGVLMKKGAGVANLNVSDVEIMRIPLPPLSEQTLIANYLDRKTTQIDTLISKKERIIELLQEERTAIINQAVTKGLDPNVPMKDSGIEWLGEIPEHWNYSKLKNYSYSKTGTTPSRDNSDYWKDGTIPWMSSGEINQKIIKYISQQVTQKAYEETSLSLFPKNAVMIAMNGQGKTKGMVGILDIETSFNQSLTGFIFQENINPKFVYYYLQSKYYDMRGLVGEDREGLNSVLLKNINFPIPSIEEQSDIVRYLENEESRIENIINKINKEIELLKEYKTALISEVVTGKVDVREEAV